MGPIMQDSTWVRQSFLVGLNDLAAADQRNSVWSTASMQFVDSSPGGSYEINPPPQFTRYADPRANTLKPNGHGCGRYWWEALGENSQRIYIRFGVPEFNSMTQFFTGFYNSGMGLFARTGRSTGIFYHIARAATMVVTFMSWKTVALSVGGQLLRFALQKPSSKFYYLKPTMPMYWGAVQTIINQIAVNMGVVPRIGGADVTESIGNQFEFSANDIAKLHSMMPDIIESNGSINAFAIATRGQRMARAHAKQLEATFAEGNFTPDNVIGSLYGENSTVNPPGDPNFDAYLDNWFSSAKGSPRTDDVNSDDKMAGENMDHTDVGNSGWTDFLRAELDDGAAFACFRVNYTGSVGESFSNNVADSELQQKINSTSSSSRTARFDFADGNIGGGLIGKGIQAAVGAVKDVVSGIADGLEISGLAVFAGNAFVDIPKHWESSVAQLPRSTYTINLVSPYGNRVSRLFNLWLPVSMLLAGVLPLSTGTQSFTSPFICEYYDKGRCQSRLAIMDSLSITRGTGNTGFNANGEALALEVSFSFVDLSSIIHMPINASFQMSASSTLAQVGGALGFGVGVVAGPPGGAAAGAAAGTALGAAGGFAVDTVVNGVKAVANVFDDDSTFTDYMAVLAAMDLGDQLYAWRRFKQRLTTLSTNFGTWFNSARFASILGDTTVGRVASIWFRGRAS